MLGSGEYVVEVVSRPASPTTLSRAGGPCHILVQTSGSSLNNVAKLAPASNSTPSTSLLRSVEAICRYQIVQRE
eukprot:380452-Amphidinium_carterae.1